MKKIISILLAGLLSAAMCVSLAGCKEAEEQKAFYTLEEAYEKKIITSEDVHNIYAIYDKPDEAVLTDNEKMKIQQSFFENYSLIIQSGAITAPVPESAGDIEIIHYYGKFQGYDCVKLSWFYEPLQYVARFTVADCTFYTFPDEYIFIWTNPEGLEF